MPDGDDDDVDGLTSKVENVGATVVVIFAICFEVDELEDPLAVVFECVDDFESSNFVTIFGSNPRLFSAFSSRP